MSVARHPPALLDGRGVGDRRKQLRIDPRTAEDGDRARRGTVRENGAAGRPLRFAASSAAIRCADQRCVEVRRRHQDR